MRRRNSRRWFVLLGMFVAVFLFAFLVQRFKGAGEAEAANLGNFDPGHIISDFQMSNYGSMSEAQIQSFLKSKNSCNDTNLNRSGVGTKVGYYSESSPLTWHVADGHFVCMADENINGESAAHIIWQAAQDYRINPQVLIVLLQKEQGLITDTFPHSVQYRSATGYGCPDTAACSSKYYGLKNQIRNAAAMFRSVLDGGWTNYPVGNNYIQYNPDASCGGSVVNIRNRATSALYRYTPYQPNAGALAAGYGTVSCGAYGNRNFYLYFEDWFGGITAGGDFNKVNYDDVKQVSIENGVYNIMIAINGPRSMEVVDNVDGGNVQVKGFDASSLMQQWQIEKVDNYYLIRNIGTGKVLDARKGIMENATNIQQWSENRGCAQRWIFGEEAGGAVVIHNACDPSYVLDLQRGESNLQLYNKSKDVNTNQSWIIKRISDVDYSGNYNIVAMGNNSKMIASEGLIDGSNMVAMIGNPDVAQQWQIEKVDNYYLIRNIGTGKVLDARKGIMENATNIQQWSENRGCAQRWIFERNKSGAVSIRNACNPGYALDLRKGETNLQIWTKNPGEENVNQSWIMKKTNPVDYSGVFNILAAGETNKSLNVIGMQDGDNAEVTLVEDTVPAQQWQIEKVDNYYLIRNIGTGKVLDARKGIMENATNIQQWSENRGCAQRWLIWENRNETITFYNACDTRYVLDLRRGETNLQMWSKDSTSDNINQDWVLKRAPNLKEYSGRYNIVSAVNDDKILGVTGYENGDNVQIMLSGDNRQWQIEKVDNYYLIRNIGTGKVLDARKGIMENATNIQQWSENRGCAQRWLIWENRDETITFYNACDTRYVLDLRRGETNLQMWSKDSTSDNINQDWVLK